MGGFMVKHTQESAAESSQKELNANAESSTQSSDPLDANVEPKKHYLAVFGSGIKTIAHCTKEAETYLRKSDKLLYLVNEPIMKEWIAECNPAAECMDDIYNKYRLRIDSYLEIRDHILRTLEAHPRVGVMLYGHPTVFAKPALDAAIIAKQRGHEVRILPGISAEDCLFADLMIDPGAGGCQSFESTDFLIHHRKFDNTSHLILWQVGIIGAFHHTKGQYDNVPGLMILRDRLLEFYPETHELALYEASQYPGYLPKIEYVTLAKLPEAKTSSLTTLYVKPAGKAITDVKMLDALKIPRTDLKPEHHGT